MDFKTLGGVAVIILLVLLGAGAFAWVLCKTSRKADDAFTGPWEPQHDDTFEGINGP